MPVGTHALDDRNLVGRRDVPARLAVNAGRPPRIRTTSAHGSMRVKRAHMQRSIADGGDHGTTRVDARCASSQEADKSRGQIAACPPRVGLTPR